MGSLAESREGATRAKSLRIAPLSTMMGPLIRLPKEEVDRESLGGLPAALFSFFFLVRMKASAAKPRRIMAPPTTPPAMAAVGGPLLAVPASEAPLVVLGSAELVGFAGVELDVVVVPPVALVLALLVLVVPAFPVLVCIGTAFWFWSITQSLPSQEKPNGQHWPPQRPRVPPSAVVLTTASGSFSPSWSEMSQGTGWIF